MNAGSSVWYRAHSDWGLGKILWVCPNGWLMAEFPDVPYIGEFHAQELEDAAPLKVAA
jgi:hypothetical protein